MTTIKITNGQEIRRITLAGEEARRMASFSAFATKVQQLFPALVGQVFSLVWYDDDGDKITVSSDIEFQEAIRSMRDNSTDGKGILRFEVLMKIELESVPCTPSATALLGEAVHCSVHQVSPLLNVPSLTPLVLEELRDEESTEMPQQGVWKVRNWHASGLISEYNSSASASLPSSEIPTKLVFVREQSKKLWDQLETFPNRLLLYGPPGVGKTTALFGWVMHKRLTKSLLWVKCLSSYGFHISVCQPDRVLTCVIQPNLEKLTNIIENFLATYGIDILVGDGFRADDKYFDSFFYLCRDCKGIFCTSYSTMTKLGQEHRTRLVRDGLRKFIMESWTFGELCDAFKCGIFDGVIRDLPMLRERYYYGGGSLRLVLMPPDECRSDLDQALNDCEDFASLRTGFVGNSSVTAINSLFQLVDGSRRLVSEYLYKRLSTEWMSQFIKEARSQLPSNPSHQGWLFELQALHAIRTKSISLTGGPDFSSEDNLWNQHIKVVSVWDVTQLAAEMPRIAPMTLIEPLKYNQGLFDVMLYVGPGKLRIANMTCAQKHSYKMNHIVPFLELCRSSTGCEVTLDIIVPDMSRAQPANCKFTQETRVATFDPRWRDMSGGCCQTLVMINPDAGRFPVLLVDEESDTEDDSAQCARGPSKKRRMKY